MRERTRHIKKKVESTSLVHGLSPIIIACWFALFTGLLHGLILMVRREIFGQFIWTGTHVVWMSPLSYLIFLPIVGLALSLIQHRFPSRDLTAVTVAIIAFLAIASLLVVVFGGRLQPLARVLLAAGLAVQLGRLLARRQAALAPAMRRSLAVMLLAVAVLAIGLLTQNGLAERAAFAALPNTSKGTPNVLMIVMDCARADHLGFYGYRRRTTPFLDRLAKRGIVFEAAYATAPWTLPSHASLFTGYWAHELSSSWLEPLDDRYPTLAGVLSDHGYRTAAISANYYYTTRETGLDRGFVHFESRPVSLTQVALSSTPGQWASRVVTGHKSDEPISDRRTAAEITARAVEWFDTEAADQKHPYFLFLNYFDAHHPADAPDEVRRAFKSDRPRVDAYDAALAGIDNQLRVLFSELTRRKMLANTIVVLTSDHGESFGEQGLRGHGHSLYRSVLQVPLVILHPRGMYSGKRVNKPVSLRDVPATVMAVAGLTNVFPGASLTRHLGAQSPGSDDPVLSAVWPGEARVPKRHPVSRGPMFSAIWKGMHYIRNGDGAEELYDLKKDSGETRNLAGNGSVAPILWSFRQYLDRQLGSAGAGQRGREARAPYPESWRRSVKAAPAAN